MSMLTEPIPESLIISGTEYKINTEHSVWIKFEQKLSDDTDKSDKVFDDIKKLIFVSDIPPSSADEETVEQILWFYNCGKEMAKRDHVEVDIVAGVPDSGIAHAVGYANESGTTYARPFIKYTPTWPRSFMPQNQVERNLIAKMKLIPVQELIKDQRLLLIDDSIVRGTQLGETTEFLYESGAKEVHVRPACPPIMFGCKYLNFARFKSEMDLISRRIICDFEGTDDVSLETIQEYADPDSEKYKKMVDEICRQLNFTSLDFARLDELERAIGVEPCKLCTYCWNGKE